VIAAFALDHWNENRNNRHAESKILSEIINGLDKDLADVQLNIVGHERGLRSITFFRNLITEKSPSTDSLTFFYFHLTRDFIAIQNTSGYETLKSKGLELVQNDSLRTNIISLYEYDFKALQKLEEEYDEMQFHKNYFKEINAALAQNFQFNKDKQIMGINTPLQFDSQQENVLLSYLHKIESNRDFALRYYTEIERKIKVVRAKIEAEINPQEK